MLFATGDKWRATIGGVGMGKLRTITDDIDYLIPLISFLGSNPFWWARSAEELARELSLDPVRVATVFDRYDSIFRKSAFDAAANKHYYSLQMRYARRKDGKTNEPPTVSALPVLSESEVIGLIDFLVRISTMESTLQSSRRTNRYSTICAGIAALAAVAAACVATLMKS